MKTLGIIITIIILIIEIDNKNKQISKLYNELNELKSKGNANAVEKTNQPQNKILIQKEIEKPTTKQNKYSKEEINNTLILIVGSVLIILSAIVFLSTTWNVTNNIFKTIVITLMLAIFKGIEYIAKTKLKLQKTAKAFKYIALGYFGIVLLSISLLEIPGKYLSFYGEGRNIYLSFAAIITTLTYYLNYKKDNDKITEVASILTSCISVICLTSILSSQIEFHTITLILYSILINILYIKDIQIYEKNIHKKAAYVLTASTIILTIHNNIFNILNPLNNISNFLILINTYIVMIKIMKNKTIFKIIYPTLTILSFLCASAIFESFNMTKTYLIVAGIILSLYDLTTKGKINDETTFEILGAIFVLFIENILYHSQGTYELPIIMTLLLCTSYISSKIKEEISNLIIISLLISVICIVTELTLDFALFGITSILLTLISETIKNKNFKKSCRLIGDIGMLIFTIIYHTNHLVTLLLYISYVISTSIHYLKTKNKNYKIITYIYLNPIIISIMSLLKLDNLVLCIPISTVITMLMETFYFKKDISKDFISFEYIISIITLNILSHTLINLIILIITNILFIAYCKKKNAIKDYLYPPLLSIIPYTLIDKIYIFNFSIMNIITLLLICIMIYLSLKKKKDIYSIMFYIYSIAHTIKFSTNIYTELAMFIIGTIILYISSKENKKEIYKIILYILSFILFKNIFKDLNISHISLFKIGIILIYISKVGRTIIKNHTKDYKILIYIGFIYTNIIAIPNYYSEYDGILYLLLLTIIVITSYIKKYGPEFITSLIFILINVLLLTKAFWINIPWWIYILIIGSILIVFGLNNELKSNTNKEKIEKLKRHLDL